MTYKEITNTADFLKSKGFDTPEIGIVLGTGLGGLINHINIICEIPYAEIPNFAEATVESHQGKLIYGTIEGIKCIVMQGRFHYYEGYTMQQITFPIRVMKVLGVKELLLSNASGAINLDYKKSELMLVDDHINLQPENPLTGKNIDELGHLFPDMSAPYNKKINSKLKTIAKNLNVILHEGVYVSVPGPNLETRAEYKYLKIIGADAVGMSTVPEVIVANHMNLPCATISVLTDECDPENLHPVALKDILETAAIGEKNLIEIIKQYLKEK